MVFESVCVCALGERVQGPTATKLGSYNVMDLGCDGAAREGFGKPREDPQLCLGDLSRFL